MYNLRGILGEESMDEMRIETIQEICSMMRSVGDRMMNILLRWYGHIMVINDKRSVKKILINECIPTRSVWGPR